MTSSTAAIRERPRWAGIVNETLFCLDVTVTEIISPTLANGEGLFSFRRERAKTGGDACECASLFDEAKLGPDSGASSLSHEHAVANREAAPYDCFLDFRIATQVDAVTATCSTLRVLVRKFGRCRSNRLAHHRIK